MGIATIPPQIPTTEMDSAPLLVIGLQPSALIDYIACVNFDLLSQIPGDPGGSFPIEIEELEHLLKMVKTHILSSLDQLSPVRTIAGGSVANTLRGLTAGFGVTCGIIGARGDNEQGRLFFGNMNSNGVDLSRSSLVQLLESGDIDLCFTNEDEASELLRDEANVNPEAALAFLGNCCQWVVVTLGVHGCIAKHGKRLLEFRQLERRM